jgi:hypothetical protein
VELLRPELFLLVSPTSPPPPQPPFLFSEEILFPENFKPRRWRVSALPETIYKKNFQMWQTHWDVVVVAKSNKGVFELFYFLCAGKRICRGA